MGWAGRPSRIAPALEARGRGNVRPPPLSGPGDWRRVSGAGHPGRRQVIERDIARGAPGAPDSAAAQMSLTHLMSRRMGFYSPPMADRLEAMPLEIASVSAAPTPMPGCARCCTIHVEFAFVLGRDIHPDQEHGRLRVFRRRCVAGKQLLALKAQQPCETGRCWSRAMNWRRRSPHRAGFLRRRHHRRS